MTKGLLQSAENDLFAHVRLHTIGLQHVYEVKTAAYFEQKKIILILLMGNVNTTIGVKRKIALPYQFGKCERRSKVAPT